MGTLDGAPWTPHNGVCPIALPSREQTSMESPLLGLPSPFHGPGGAIVKRQSVEELRHALRILEAEGVDYITTSVGINHAIAWIEEILEHRAAWQIALDYMESAHASIPR